MTNTTFDTKNDVTGFTHQPAPVEYRGFELRCVDVSGANSFGYRFALIPRATGIDADEYDQRWEELYKLEHRLFATSTTLHFRNELNRIGSRGCFSSRWFRDEDVEHATNEFRAAVDQYHGSAK